MSPPPSRIASLDLLRGFAVVWMTAFHFCFDLNVQGFLRQDFLTDPFWTWQRTAIVTLFVGCAGAGQALAVASAQGWPRFWRRWLQIAGCALLVTAGSWWMFPRSFIYFGVLHGLAAMLVVARLTAGAGPWLWPLGALALALPWVAPSLWAASPAEAIFNARPLNVLGLVTQKPFTEDYVPLFPWLGVMWWGIAAGDMVLRRARAGGLQGAGVRPAAWAAVPIPTPARTAGRRPEPGSRSGSPTLGTAVPRAVARPLAWLGRHSLLWYMLHQPVLLGLLAGVAWLR